MPGGRQHGTKSDFDLKVLTICSLQEDNQAAIADVEGDQPVDQEQIPVERQEQIEEANQNRPEIPEGSA